MSEIKSENAEITKVSAIVTTYNRPQEARRAIRSVLAQTYQALEVIVVEDGSDSGIEAWLKQEGWNHVQYVRHVSNKGLAAARNTGISLTKGEYIGFLDDDDEWTPERIDRQVQLLDTLTPTQKEKLGVIYCGTEVRYPSFSRVRIDSSANKGSLKEAIIQQGAKTPSSSFLFSKKALQSVGGFDETLLSCIDHDIWMALAVGGYEAHYVDKPLVINYDRSNRQTMITDTAKRIRGVRQYVEKWIPVYQQWLGDEQGLAYGEKYFARVMALLAGQKLAEGKLSEFNQTVHAIFNFSKQHYYNFSVITQYVVRLVVRRVIPPQIIAWVQGH